jgi:hypothetical protein
MRSRPRLFCLATFIFAISSAISAEPVRHMAVVKEAGQSAAYRWLDIAQEATAREVDRNAP